MCFFFWHEKLVKIYCDNESVVCVLSTIRTCDDLLGAFAHSYTASRDIQLQYSHIAGIKNVLPYPHSRYFSRAFSSTGAYDLQYKQWHRVEVGYFQPDLSICFG